MRKMLLAVAALAVLGACSGRDHMSSSGAAPPAASGSQMDRGTVNASPAPGESGVSGNSSTLSGEGGGSGASGGSR